MMQIEAVEGPGGEEASMVEIGVQLARALHIDGAGLQETLDAVIATAIDVVAPAEWGGIIVVERGKLVPKATLGAPPTELDLYQQREGEGPCLEAAATQTVIHVTDTATEDRWPHFAACAVALGARSVLCAPIWIHAQLLGTLSLYSPNAEVFGPVDLQLTELLATHAALALGTAAHVAQLEQALANRDLIGQAKGILMERDRIGADDAFRRLVRTSQATNVKVVEVARRLAVEGLIAD